MSSTGLLHLLNASNYVIHTYDQGPMAATLHNNVANMLHLFNVNYVYG